MIFNPKKYPNIELFSNNEAGLSYSLKFAFNYIATNILPY